MKWTKRHSQNAVAARERKRNQPPDLLNELPPVNMRRQRKGRAHFRIQIRDLKRGDSLTLTLHDSPWPNRYVCEQGEFSAAHIGRSVALILTPPYP